MTGLEENTSLTETPLRPLREIPAIKAKTDNQPKSNQEEHSYNNFIFLYGSPPKLTIEIETTMVTDLISGLSKQIEMQKYFIKVPDVFEDLKSANLRFETNASGTL